MCRAVPRTVLVCSCLALGLTVATGRAQRKAERRYDGHWWLSVTQAEQSGFLNGYFDCYTYEYKGPAKFTVNPPEIAWNLVTNFYEHNASRLNDSVASVFYGFRDRRGEKPTASDGEPIKGWHSYYRGLYWMQISADSGPQLEQRGYVEGYLGCHSALSDNRGGVFSKSPDEYVSLITNWYGFVRDTGDINAKRQPAPIAEVLFRFRDLGRRSRSGRK